MKMITTVLVSFGFAFFLQACREEVKIKSYQHELKICDPQDNPSACPLALRDDAVSSRTLKLGDEGEGIKVVRPNDSKILEACRQAKLSILEAYLEPSSTDKGLFRGEFVANTSYSIVSEGAQCASRTFTRSCSKEHKFVRVVCEYEVKSSLSLK